MGYSNVQTGNIGSEQETFATGRFGFGDGEESSELQ